MTQNFEKLKQWIGRRASDLDYVTIPAVHRLAATLDRADPMPKTGDPLPVGDRSPSTTVRMSANRIGQRPPAGVASGKSRPGFRPVT